MGEKNKYIHSFSIDNLWNRLRLTWNDIYPDVNIIVGINGSGKTTLLNCIYDYYNSKKSSYKCEGTPLEIPVYFIRSFDVPFTNRKKKDSPLYLRSCRQTICRFDCYLPCSVGSAFYKNEGNLPNIYKQSKDWRKYKRLKISGWSMFSIGAAAIITGVLGENIDEGTNSNWSPSNGRVWKGVIYSGVAIAASSIPLFVVSHKNKRKAKETVEFSLRNSSIHLDLPNGMRQPRQAVGVCMNF